MTDSSNLTQLLVQMSEGDTSVLPQLSGAILSELHRLAKIYMSKENSGHTLQATALVNEAYLRLIDTRVNWQDRAHFFAVAAKQMRRILVDHARAKTADKRGGKVAPESLDSALAVGDANLLELVYLDQLLVQLTEFDERAARMFEMRLFAGLSNTDIARLELLSVATVEREMKVAKSWIQHQLAENS